MLRRVYDLGRWARRTTVARPWHVASSTAVQLLTVAWSLVASAQPVTRDQVAALRDSVIALRLAEGVAYLGGGEGPSSGMPAFEVRYNADVQYGVDDFLVRRCAETRESALWHSARGRKNFIAEWDDRRKVFVATSTYKTSVGFRIVGTMCPVEKRYSDFLVAKAVSPAKMSGKFVLFGFPYDLVSEHGAEIDVPSQQPVTLAALNERLRLATASFMADSMRQQDEREAPERARAAERMRIMSAQADSVDSANKIRRRAEFAADSVATADSLQRARVTEAKARSRTELAEVARIKALGWSAAITRAVLAGCPALGMTRAQLLEATKRGSFPPGRKLNEMLRVDGVHVEQIDFVYFVATLADGRLAALNYRSFVRRCD